MSHDLELHELMQLIAEKGLLCLTHFKNQPGQLTTFLENSLDASNNYQDLITLLLTHPKDISQSILAYWQDAIDLLQKKLKHWQEGSALPINDKRFSSEEWIHNPFFNLLSQHYLLASEHLNSLLKRINYNDKRSEVQIQFFTRRLLDALSPDNFLHTNPQLISETLQSHGKNLLQGLLNFLSDIDVDSSRLRIKMTDTTAFQIGINIAITPGHVIFRNDLIELIQYTPQTPQVASVPLLIIPPWINKYYILDLSPNNSMIRWLVSHGITVFIISWVNPNATFAHKGLYDYLHEGPVAAIKMIQTQLQVKQVNTMGFCIGGTLLAILLGYYQFQQKNPIKSATFLATMLDFSDPGDISVFIDEQQLTKLEAHMKNTGYLCGDFMASAFNSLRANDLIWSFFIKNYLRGKSAVPFDTLYWNGDSTNMPATMHIEYLRSMYLNNDLVKPGKIHLNKIPIDISNITIPTFFVGTQKDHIAPWKTTYLGFQLMRGKKQFTLGNSGHIAGIIIPPTSEKYGFYRNNKCLKNPNDWLAKATYHTGSWWPDWMLWLRKKSGKLIKAPDINQLPLQSILSAPGSYVHMKHK